MVTIYNTDSGITTGSTKTYTPTPVLSKVDKIKDRESKSVIDSKLRRNSKQNISYTMDGSVKQLFLNLTKMQIPFDYEKTLEPLFPKGMKRDEHGNYFIKIGNTKTMFCGHLDTYCYEYRRVWHVIDGDIIKTDGTTTLGGDDKAGITVMIKMIEANVPGLYYFFRGEEGVTSPTGTWGSKQALKSYKELFKTYDKCIAFDRKGTESIITKQMYSECCSKEFTKELLNEFEKSGLIYKDDPTGMWCDSGVFMEIIPECTNISIGYKDEHTFNETQNIKHLEDLVTACINTDWENLPVKRDPTVKYDWYSSYNKKGKYSTKYYTDYEDDIYDSRYGYGNYGGSKIPARETNYNVKQYKTMKEVYAYVVQLLHELGYESFNNIETFSEGEEMYFQKLSGEYEFFGVKIIDYDIYISNESLTIYDYIGNIDKFESYVSLGKNDKEVDSHLNSIMNAPDTFDEYLKVNNKNTPILDEQGEEYTFTKKQYDIFTKFIKDNKEILFTIMKSIKDNSTNKLSSDDWLSVELAMIDNEIVINYEFHGINPDDLSDWVSVNWDTCEQILGDTKNKPKPNIKETEEKLRSGLNNIFTTKQINTFTDIALNKKPNVINNFIEQVVKKGILENEMNYNKYVTTVDVWITQSGYKVSSEIDSESFLDWIQYNYKDIEEYNGK